MATGLYSGTSGLALGVGLYEGNPGLWGGAPGLITGNGASLYLNFLAGAPLDSRVTFSRGSNATLVDSTGKITYAPANLLLRSQTFETANWNKTAATVTADSTTAPDGTSTADAVFDNTSNSLHFVQQAPTLTAGQTIVISFYAKANTLSRVLVRENSITGFSVSFDLSSGTILATNGSVTGSITNVGNGWYRCAMVQGIGTTGSTAYGIFTLPAGGSTFANATYVGTGQSLYLWGAQLEPVTYQTTPSTYVATTTAAYYGPRFDYDPVTLAAKGLLIEEQRTNLLSYSEQFDNISWSKTNSTVTANATTSPDGTVNADKLIESATSGTHFARTTAASTNIAYTLSTYLKAGERTRAVIAMSDLSTGDASIGINLSTGATFASGLGVGSWTNISSTVVAMANGWYRVTLTATRGGAGSSTAATIYTDNGSAINYTGDGTSGIFLWGAQLEAGAFATSYIPTVASTVTRSADVATMTGTNFSSWYNQSEGTFVADFDKYSTASRGGVLCAGNISGASGNGITLDGQNDGKVRAFIENAGSLVMSNLTLADYTANTPIKGAIAYATNNSVGAAAGALGTVDTSVAVPTVDNFQIGAIRNTTSAAVLPLNGHIRQIAYYNTRLSNATLQALTA